VSFHKTLIYAIQKFKKNRNCAEMQNLTPGETYIRPIKSGC